ncbi:putative sugar transferase EpsL [Kushneria phyllosphaerae]|uniref:Putative sugar transferase EpsL n=2 Tax=Kushneria phyllosphaerae TaxID=2100822 RepID=A0A2R8CHU2_9GAMM|nr:putative sugar transferase EpsL [Kushneria phyllosphaerae]
MNMYVKPIEQIHTAIPFTGSRAMSSAVATAPKCTTLFGLELLAATREEAVARIMVMASSRQRNTVNFVNAHCINVAARDATYRHHLQSSDLLLPDGSGMRLASKLARAPLGDNLNGTDLFPLLCEQAAARGLPLYLLGGTPGTAERAAHEMQSRYPALIVAGTQHGYFDHDQNDDVIGAINAAGPALLFVGFGVPVQENWIAEHRQAIDASVVLGVGGLFDYYAGNVVRAPALVRRVGCEWGWRLMQEPQRLASRYLIGNLLFILHALVYATTLWVPSGTGYQLLKRTLDIMISVMALVMLSPLLLMVALIIRGEDGGPVMFAQQRIGAGGRPFTMLKFRSMGVDAEARRAALVAQSERDGVCFKMKRDPRITRVGYWLRKTSLDELPQLINVLRGEMSIVGPRPALPEEVVTYAGASWQRLMGKPGITCTWQVSGRADIPFDRQVIMDIEYLSQRSLRRDIMLILQTVPAVLASRGAY